MNSPESSFVFGVDLDGVVADFYAGLLPIAADWLGVEAETLPAEVSCGLSEWGVETAPGGYEALHKYAVTQRDLFSSLPPIAGAPQGLRLLSNEDVRIRIITHRLFIKYFHQQAVQQTIQWLDYHDIPYWDLCFMRDKSAVGAHLYIDDTPANVRALRVTGHHVIVFGNSTNRDFDAPRADTWDVVVDQVLEARGKWQAGQWPAD